MPCNFHLRGLAEHVKEGVRAAGGTPMEFNTIAISDGITMGTQGMKTSLVSREVIADSIELTARGYQFDAVIALSGCDKTIPGCVMALARLDIPSLMLYGGSIAARPLARQGRDDPGRLRGDRRARRRRDVRRGAATSSRAAPAPAPAPAAASSPPTRWPARSRRSASRPMGSAMVPADGRRQGGASPRECGELVMQVLAEDLRPSQIITSESLENAIATVCTSGGSTNGVLHLLAVAREAGIELEIADFERISEQHAAARRPEAGRPLRRHRPLSRPAASALLAKRLAEAGLLHRDAHHRHRQDDRRGGRRGAAETPGQDVVRPLADPLKPTGGLAILRGNLAPEGAWSRSPARSAAGQTGPARVFELRGGLLRGRQEQAASSPATSS